MPPNSFCEWAVGFNVNRNKKRPGKRPVVALSVETDDETDTDTVTLAYPRTSSTGGGARQVEQPPEPPKPALKSAPTDAPAQPESEVSLGYINYGISDSDGITSSDEEVLPSCPCLRCVMGRRRLRRLKQVKGKNYRQQVALSSEDESEEESRVVHAMHKAMEAQKAMQRNTKANYARNHQRKSSKQKRYIDSDSTDTTEAESDSESESNSEDSDTLVSSDDELPVRRKNKQRGRRGSSYKGKKKNKQGSRKQKDKSARNTRMDADNEDDSERARQKLVPRHIAPAGKPVPDYIMGPRAHVLHVEHAVESPHDPRPNAFYDNDNGVMRVYHGPAYGNPLGALYPKLGNSRYQQPLPFGTPHPSYNPWYHGFPPQDGGRQIPPPPGGPPPPPRPDASNWFQGWGTTTASEGAPSSPQKSTIPDIPPVPEFTYDRNKFNQAMRDNLSPEMDSHRRQGIDSNVFPSMEGINRPSHHRNKRGDDLYQGSTRKTGHPELWGTQSAPEPSGYNSPPRHGDGRRRSKNKRNDNAIDEPKIPLSQEIDEIIARDRARLKAMDEKWARKYGTHLGDGNVDGSADKKTETWDNNIDDDYIRKLNESHGLTNDNDDWGKQNENNGFANDNNTWDKTNGNDGFANTDTSWANGTNWNDNNDNGNTDNNSGTNGSDTNGSRIKTSPMPGGWTSPSARSEASNQFPPGADGGNVMAGDGNPYNSPEHKGKANDNGGGTSNESLDWDNNTMGDPSKRWGDPNMASSSGGAFDNDKDDDIWGGGGAPTNPDNIKW